MNSFAFLGIVCIVSCIAQTTLSPSQTNFLQFLIRCPIQTMYFQLREDPNFMPSFLQNCSEDARQQFLNIFEDGSVTAMAMYETVMNWRNSQDSQVQVTFTDHVKKIKRGALREPMSLFFFVQIALKRLISGLHNGYWQTEIIQELFIFGINSLHIFLKYRIKVRYDK